MTPDKRKLFKVHSKQELHLLPAVNVLRIPQGLFYSRNHTWTHLEKSGLAEVGIDDFLIHITGEVKFRILKKPGNFINKGDLLAEIDQNGKQLQIYSPISGRIIETNSMLYESPGIINEDPYGKGWIYKMQPSEWIAETESCYLANAAISWSKKELVRFKDFMAVSVRKYSPEASMLILQDGGELRDRPLSVLPDEVWQDFQKSFLN
jgi:glycine cleavage system H protein